MVPDEFETLERVQERLDILQAITPQPEVHAAWCHQDEIIGLLSSVTQSLCESSRNRSSEYSHIRDRITKIESAVDHIQRDIATLCKLVRDGNGQPSLLQRLGTLENVIESHSGKIREVKEHANAIIVARALSRSQLIVGVSGMIITVLLSSLALAATLLK